MAGFSFEKPAIFILTNVSYFYTYPKSFFEQVALGCQACVKGVKTSYYNMMKLFEELAFARISCTQHKFFNKLAATDLLVLDDLGIRTLDGQQSAIVISQLPVSNWYYVLQGFLTVADAILDRLAHTAIRFEFKGESLMWR